MNGKLRQVFAEGMGSLIIIFMAAGSIVTDSYTHGAVGLLGVALAYGLMTAVATSAFGLGHFNPAITIGSWIAHKTNSMTAVFYIVAQLLGASLAGVLLRLIFPEAAWQAVHLGTPAIAVGISPAVGLALEAILTFILMLVVLGMTRGAQASENAGLGIGLTIAVETLVAWPLTGAAMNPARVWGPGLAGGFWENHWIYWVGPIAGASLASWLYTRCFSKTSS